MKPPTVKSLSRSAMLWLSFSVLALLGSFLSIIFGKLSAALILSNVALICDCLGLMFLILLVKTMLHRLDDTIAERWDREDRAKVLKKAFQDADGQF